MLMFWLVGWLVLVFLCVCVCFVFCSCCYCCLLCMSVYVFCLCCLFRERKRENILPTVQTVTPNSSSIEIDQFEPKLSFP